VHELYSLILTQSSPWSSRYHEDASVFCFHQQRVLYCQKFNSEVAHIRNLVFFILFVYHLFNSAVSSLDCIALNGRMVTELGSVWREVILV
jgi:hypothetical protein